MNNIILKKGSHVFLSEIGHKGFLYPESRETVVLYSARYDTLAWVGSNSKQAILVPENSVIISGNPNRKIPVWIQNEK